MIGDRSEFVPHNLYLIPFCMPLKRSNIPTSKHSRSWFTLIELMIAMTIFGMMSIMVMTIYLSTTQTARRLDAQRLLAESAREITERLTEDIRQHGFSWQTAFELNSAYAPWGTNDYTGSGNEYLNLKNGVYVYGAKTSPTTIKSCRDTPSGEQTKTDQTIHCWLYYNTGSTYYNLVDSFTPDEDRKRVKIQNLRFYTSGNGTGTTMKTTLVMDLALMPRSGVSRSLIETTRLHIQTTISERGWRKN